MKFKDIFNINEKIGKAVWLFVVLVIVAALVYYFFIAAKTVTSEFITAQITRGTISNKVSATGIVQAVTTVAVGSQASGTISAIYVDFNSVVHKGQIIAELDPSSLLAQVQQAQANLDQTNANYQVALANLANARAQLSAAQSTVLNQRAGVSSAQANLKSLKAQSDDALSLLKKYQTLFADGIVAGRDVEVAQTSYKSALAKYEQAAAQVNQAKVGEQSAQNSGIDSARASIQQMESQIQATQAQIRQSTASLKIAQINLSRTTITSPIDGVVVSRQIDVGQTVAASLSAPTLFSIANDLSQMQVLANIDEADIGSIKESNKVSFSVDAFPGDSFKGAIRQMRLNSQTVQNVVTYSVVIDVDNPEQKLKPGMTASLIFVIAEKENAIKIPNSAFRFSPQARTSSGNSNRANRNQNSPPIMANSETGEIDQPLEETKISSPTSPVLPGQTRIVWTLDANKNPVRHRVKIGISDGTATEMLEGDLKEGDAIIVGETTSGTTKASNTHSAPGFGGSGRPPGR